MNVPRSAVVSLKTKPDEICSAPFPAAALAANDSDDFFFGLRTACPCGSA
jgi:hypothetical protein